MHLRSLERTHAVVLEVRAHRLAVDVVHARITHDHAAPVLAEAIGHVGKVHVEAALRRWRRVDEGLVVLEIRACLHIDLELTVRAGAHRRTSGHRHGQREAMYHSRSSHRTKSDVDSLKAALCCDASLQALSTTVAMQ